MRNWQMSGIQLIFQKRFSAGRGYSISHYYFVADILDRYSKKIPSDVAEWLQYMKTKSGAVFFVLGAYTDEDGGLSIAK